MDLVVQRLLAYLKAFLCLDPCVAIYQDFLNTIDLSFAFYHLTIDSGASFSVLCRTNLEIVYVHPFLFLFVYGVDFVVAAPYPPLSRAFLALVDDVDLLVVDDVDLLVAESTNLVA